MGTLDQVKTRIRRRNHINDFVIYAHFTLTYFLVAFIAKEYSKVPKIAIEEPMIDPVLIGVLKAMTDATIITTRLIVLPTACVTGLTLPKAKKATSLYA